MVAFSMTIKMGRKHMIASIEKMSKINMAGGCAIETINIYFR